VISTKVVLFHFMVFMSNPLSFRSVFILGNEKKLHSARSGEYGGFLHVWDFVFG
jgi:hypothetical protein